MDDDRIDEATCEHCASNAEELRTVGMDHPNYAPGTCGECGTDWPAP